MNGKRHVCFCTDDGGFAPLVVAAHSLLSRADPSRPLTVHVLSVGPIAEVRRARLADLVGGFRFASLEWHPVDAFVTAHEATLRRASGHWNLAIWGRCFLDRILPDEIGRVVYLDTDVLVCEDLEPLFSLEMGSCVLAGVRERADYVNSGVLVFHVGNYRRAGGADAVLSALVGRSAMACPDQDALNAAFAGRIAFLPFRWNYTDGWLARQLRCRISEPLWRGLPATEILEAIARPAIIHYLGGQHKPWRPNHRPERRRYAEAMRAVGQVPPRADWAALLHDAWYAWCRIVAGHRLARLRGGHR